MKLRKKKPETNEAKRKKGKKRMETNEQRPEIAAGRRDQQRDAQQVHERRHEERHGPCTSRSPLKAILIIILTHALVHASKQPPPLSLSSPHSATRPPTNTPLRHHQALQASSLTAYGKVAMHLQSRSTTVRRSRYLATLNPTQSRDSTARTLRRKEQDAARHDAPFATRRNNFASPTQPCRPLTPTSLEAGLRYDVTRFMPRGALGTNF